MTHKHDKKSMLSQGVFIFVYLAVLTGLEFFVAITFNSVAVLVAVALVKAVLVVYYYMHIYELNADGEGDENSYEYKTGTNRLGLWLFLISDSFVFGGLMVMRMNLLGLTRPHLNQTLGLLVTAVLLISSFFMNRGETMMKNGDRKGFLNSTLITFLLGLGFFIGVVAVEWRLAAHEGLTPTSGPAGAAFYMMTGMHAFHVLTGLIFLAIVWINGRKGLYDEKHYPVEAAAVYWHFIDVVWIFFYPALYLVGAVVG
ncbi:MAG TPA: heme-copper oxidase subunit III [Anaerolineae bacterium]|nr:heme-copper oxidase subunit III [Anaerolineae bacterium]